jgi:hypothetical protein
MYGDLSSPAAGHCLLLIPAPSDGAAYRCFQVLAQRWGGQLTAQKLSIEGDVPLTPDFTAREPSGAILKLLHANLDVIARMELDFGGLKVVYLRSGGHGPQLFRTSYFDEVKFEVEGESTLDREQLGQLLLELSTALRASAATGTAEFSELTDALPFRVRSIDSERRP